MTKQIIQLRIYNEPNDPNNTYKNYNLLASHFNKRIKQNGNMKTFDALYFGFWNDSYKLFRTNLEEYFIVDSEEIKRSRWILCVNKIHWTFHKKQVMPLKIHDGVFIKNKNNLAFKEMTLIE